ncbi:MAG: ATP-binding protein [Pseudomonadota bacterium]
MRLPELDNSNPYQRLRGQMLIVLLLFGLIPLVVAGGAGFLAYQQENEARTRNVLESMVKNRKATIDLFLEEKLRQLELAGASLSVEQLSRPELLESIRDCMRRDDGGIVDLGLISEQGKHLAYIGPYSLQDRDYHDEPWFKEVMVRGRHQSDVFLGFRRFPHMVMAVKKREAGHSFVLRVTIDTDRLSQLVREGGLESGADVFILNRTSELQTHHSHQQRLMEKSDLGIISPHSGVRVVEQVHGRQNELVATAWLHGDSWALVARQRVPGYSALLGAHPGVIFVFVLGLIAIPVLSYLIARHRLRQIRGLEAEHAALFESAAQSQKMAAIGRLAAGIAHEINNPLAVIHAQVGVLTDRLDEEEQASSLVVELRERLRKITAQVDRGRKVTHRLLGFSRRVGPDEEPVDVQAALEETIAFVEKDAESSQIRLVRSYDPEVPIIRSSLSQMQQVFLNLINNAMDALARTPARLAPGASGDSEPLPGGTKDGEIQLAIAKDENAVLVRIADNGPGIAETDLAHVFEPFFSTKGSTHNGLGLAICREIMRGLGGRIEVRSKLGEGTTFNLWFPFEIGRSARSDSSIGPATGGESMMGAGRLVQGKEVPGA